MTGYVWSIVAAGMLGVGVAILGFCIGVLLYKYRSKRKFKKFLERIKAAGEEIVKEKSKKEISELSFRDKYGVMNTVRIIIDHDLGDKIEDIKVMQEMLKSGDAGTLNDLMSGHKISEDAMGKVQEFVFSPQAVRDMRSSGLEPDEVVTKMLRASGRME